MVGLSLGIATMGAIIAGGRPVLTGVPAPRRVRRRLSDARRVNAGVALIAALVVAATISSVARAARCGQAVARR